MFFGISGPSGVGKGSVVRRVLDATPHLRRVRMLTDRPSRGDEMDEAQFEFLSAAELSDLDRRGRLAAVNATYGLFRYAVSHEAVAAVGPGEAGIAELDNAKIRQFSQHYPTVGILLLAPSLAENRRRLTGRGALSAGELHQRLHSAHRVLSAAGDYDYICVNRDLDVTAALVCGIVAAELAKRALPSGVDLALRQAEEAARLLPASALR